MPHVASICYTPAGVEKRPAGHYSRVMLAEAVLVEGHGIYGDGKGGSNNRQINVMTTGTVDQLRAEGFKTLPGELGEQIVIAGIDDSTLTPGTRLALGESVVIEVTLARTGCDRFAHIQCKSKESAKGRLGVLARVNNGGVIRTGDPVRVLA